MTLARLAEVRETTRCKHLSTALMLLLVGFAFGLGCRIPAGQVCHPSVFCLLFDPRLHPSIHPSALFHPVAHPTVDDHELLGGGEHPTPAC